MASDDFDPEDLNPPGTMTPSPGLSPDDPLYDWGSNIHPSQLQQYVHDPEGFKQNMIDQGIPPPQHNYVDTGGGQLQAVHPQTGQPVFSQASADTSILGDPSQGNLTRDLNQPPQTARSAVEALAPRQPATRALAFGENPEGPSPWDPQLEEQMRSGVKGAPLTPTPQPPPKIEERLPQEVPLPQGRPREAPKRAEEEEPKPEEPLDITSDKQKEALRKKRMEDTSGGLNQFAKSLQGIKAPTPPQGVKVGTPSVRGPVGIQAPQVASLLSLIGAHSPAAVPSLMRLLGRA